MARHCRCRNKTACGKRFKGTPGVTPCPHCGGESRLDKWAAKRGWQSRALCHCDGYWWSIRGAPHKLGSPHCKGPAPPLPTAPITDEYPF